MRAISLALDTEQARYVLEAQGDERLAIVERIEEEWDEDWVYQHDKAWDPVHRCLGDGGLESPEPTSLPLQAVLGGDELTPEGDDDRFLRFVPAHRVPAVAEALAPITREWFRARYDTLGETDYRFPSDDDFDYAWENFVGLRAFFVRAANAQRGVLFSL
jgi:hypothetical protein